MRRIEALEFDERVLDEIESRQGVSFDEIEEACLGRQPMVLGRGDGPYRLLGRTRAGRYLTTVLEDTGDGVWAIRAARGMTGREWRRYQAEQERSWTPMTSRPTTREPTPGTARTPPRWRSPGRSTRS